MVFNDPFEIIRTQWNSSAHQSNQNYNGKVSKAVPATFKIAVHRSDSWATPGQFRWYKSPGPGLKIGAKPPWLPWGLRCSRLELIDA